MFLLGAVCEWEDPDLAAMLWGAILLASFAGIFIIASARIYHPGARRFFPRLLVVWVGSIPCWWLMAFLFGFVRRHGIPSYVALLSLWPLSMSFWSAVCYSWFMLGVFEPESKGD